MNEFNKIPYFPAPDEIDGTFVLVRMDDIHRAEEEIQSLREQIDELEDDLKALYETGGI